MAKPVYEAFNKMSSNAAVLANLIDAVRFNRDAPASELWNLQDVWNHAAYDPDACAKDRVDFQTISRSAWLVHPDRMTDLDRTTLNAFRLSVEKNLPFEENNLLDHLPLHELEGLKGIINHESYASNGSGRIATTDQLAVIYHLSRLGASIYACQNFFPKPLTDHPVTICRSITQDSFGPFSVPGWNWPA